METITDFHNRIYDCNTGKILVWKTIKDKEAQNDKLEVWSLQTVRNYLNWLEKNGA